MSLFIEDVKEHKEYKEQGLSWVKPYQLKQGMKIAFTAPASASKDVLRDISLLWEKAGYVVEFGKTCYNKGVFGGTPEEQAREFNYFMAESDCDAVIALRGGYGTARYLDLLDYAAIREAGKPFVGYSDCTGLHLAIGKYSRLITYHGLMGVDQLKNDEADFKHLLMLLEGKVKTIEPLPQPPRGDIGSDLGTGRLLGGNLAILTSLCGTPYFPSLEDWRESILFIEEIGEAPYRIDRMLQQLRLAGVLKAVKGVAIGNFLDCEDEEEPNYEVGAEVLTYLQNSRADRYGHIEEGEEPFVFYLPTGHGKPHKSVPLGSMVSFRAVANTMVCLPYSKG